MLSLDALRPAESRLLQERDTGALVDGGAAVAADPSLRQVRAEFLVDIACGTGSCEGHPARIIHLSNVEVIGKLDFEAARICAPLILDRCLLGEVNLEQAVSRGVAVVRCDVRRISAIQLSAPFFDLRGSTVEYGVRLSGADVQGNLLLEGARLRSGNGPALEANNLTVGGDLAGNGLDAVGEIWLRGTHIAGALNLRGARVRSQSDVAVEGQELRVDQDLNCNDDFLAVGSVRLVGAVVQGQVGFRGATLVGHGEKKEALAADLMTVGHDMVCLPSDPGDPDLGDPYPGDQRLTVQGQLRLPGANIHGRLDLRGALIVNAEGKTLFAEGLKVGESLLASAAFTSSGTASLAGAQIEHTLCLEGANLGGCMDLRGAKVGSLDDRGASWPRRLRLKGLNYQSFADIDDAGSVEKRLAWIRRDQGGYSPQIYNELARAYRSAGRDGAARDVLVAKLRMRSRARRTRATGRVSRWTEVVLDRLQDWTVGYGYRPLRGFLWLVGFVAVGSVLFSWLYRNADLEASFNPTLYALDLLLPVAGLKQADAVASPPGGVEWWNAGFTILGWLLGVVLLAGLSGLFKKD